MLRLIRFSGAAQLGRSTIIIPWESGPVPGTHFRDVWWRRCILEWVYHVSPLIGAPYLSSRLSMSCISIFSAIIKSGRYKDVSSPGLLIPWYSLTHSVALGPFFAAKKIVVLSCKIFFDSETTFAEVVAFGEKVRTVLIDTQEKAGNEKEEKQKKQAKKEKEEVSGRAEWVQGWSWREDWGRKCLASCDTFECQN